MMSSRILMAAAMMGAIARTGGEATAKRAASPWAMPQIYRAALSATHRSSHRTVAMDKRAAKKKRNQLRNKRR